MCIRDSNETIVKRDDTPQDYGEQIVVQNKSITIDLNGHTIKNDNTHPDYAGHAAIRVDAGGDLTITDSSSEKTGAVVGISEAAAAHGGAVITVVGGTLPLEGGTATGNTTTAQGGGIFVKNGTVTAVSYTHLDVYKRQSWTM